MDKNSQYLKREEWTHIAVTVDFRAKTFIVYVNGIYLNTYRWEGRNVKIFVDFKSFFHS